MWRILVPLQYLRIAHPEKWKFDLGLPLILAAVFVLPIFSSTFVTDALGTFDIVGKLSSFLGVLTGFFIAALAALRRSANRKWMILCRANLRFGSSIRSTWRPTSKI
jgi:hypothetical protein